MDARPNIKVIVAAGVSAPDAIRSALPGTLSEFCKQHGFHLPRVSRVIHGHIADARIRSALAGALYVDVEFINDILDEHGDKAA